MGSASTPPPPQNNPGKDLLKYVEGLKGALPSLAQLEGQYRPEFSALNLGDISQFLMGGTKGPGIIGMGGQATQASGQQLADARAQEIGTATGQTQSVMGLLGGINPIGQSMMQSAGDMATQRFNAAQSLNPQEARMATQTAREAFGARGRLNDNASVAGEILQREEVLSNKRNEAMQYGAQASQMANEFSSPALGILLGAPASAALGQDYLGRGMQSLGSATPQLIDTGAGISLGQQQAGNLASWQQNVSSAKNAQSAQNTQTGAAVASAALMALAAFSDKRVKEDIKKVGKTDEGMPIYTYKYKGSPKTQMGVMAQDVKKKKPSALGPVLGGIMTVDYSKIK